MRQRGGKAAGHGSVMLNLRMQRSGGGSASKAEREAALERLLDNGTVPKGWKMAAIEWKHPGKGSPGWVAGGSKDLDRFLPILRAVGLGGLRMAPVEGTGRKPTKKEREQIKGLNRKAGQAGAKEAKAQRALSRSKLPETRKRHNRVLREARAIRLDVAGKLRRWEVLFEDSEYEVAVDYGQKKGRR